MSTSDVIQTAAGPLTVTRAAATDVTDVLAVVHAAVDRLAAAGSTQWAYYRTADGAARVRDRIEQHEVYLARPAAGPPVGTLCLQWADPLYWPEDGDDGSAAYVHQLAVATPARGVGAALLAWAAARAAAAGRRRLRLDCLAANAGLCRYYAARGFRPAGTVAPRGDLAQRWERDV